MDFTLLPYAIFFGLLQAVAAVPWVVLLLGQTFREWFAQAPLPRLAICGAVVLGLGIGLGIGLVFLLDVAATRPSLEDVGWYYGSLLQLQLMVDLLILGFWLLLAVWPKGGAVARAAFREGYRQPMYWVLLVIGLLILVFLPFVPYFTFGEDHIMFKELGYDVIMFVAVLFGVLSAAMSINEEIEGRTAVTLMSKPVSRRQFILGKFAGILMVCLVLVFGLGWAFEHILTMKRWLDRLDPQVLPVGLSTWLDGAPALNPTLPRPAEEVAATGALDVPDPIRHFLRGGLLWTSHAMDVVPGLIMASSLVMVMLAVAVTLATRLPMVVNLVTCLVLYVLSNLMPNLVLSTKPRNDGTDGPVQKLLHFIAQLFDALLPGLDHFRVRPTVVDESTLPLGDYMLHVGAVTFYGIMFTAIILLLGLVMFEDRDLA